MKIKQKNSCVIMMMMFILFDILLFILFGVCFLNGLEFTALSVSGEALPGTKTQFGFMDYFLNCTSFCIIEDIAISLVYASCLRAKKSLKIDKTADPVYFWLAHICLKILLNINSTTMFISSIRYSRESDWQHFTNENGILKTNSYFRLPDNCFDAQRKSLILALVTVVAAFAVFLYLPVFLKKPKSNKRINLYRYSLLINAGIIAFTFIWIILVTLTHQENKNSFHSIQYSALVKLAAPLILIINSLFYKLECLCPDKYVRHTSNSYAARAIVSVITACLALMLLGEFGSIVCIVFTTELAFLFLFSFTGVERNRSLPLGKDKKYLKGLGKSIAFSLLIGVIESAGIISAECLGLVSLLRYAGCSTRLGGELFGISLDSSGAYMLESVFVLLALLVVFMLVTLPAPVNMFMNRHMKKSGKRIMRLMRRCGSHVSVLIIMLVITSSVLLFNFSFEGFGGRTILKSYYMTAGNFNNESEITRDITSQRAREVAEAEDLSKKTKAEREALTEPKSASPEAMNSISERYSDSTVRSVVGAVYVSDEKLTLEDIRQFYNPKVYSKSNFICKNFLIKSMVIIDRLCFSTKTDQLIKVNNGLKQNMGFDVGKAKKYNNYIVSFQYKYYLTPEDIRKAPADVQRVYLDENGNPREPVKFLNINGEIADRNEQQYVFIPDKTETVLNVRFSDSSVETITIEEQKPDLIFRSAEPETASSDYALYTLSSLGVGNMLLLIFIPFFFMLVLVCEKSVDFNIESESPVSCYRFIMHSLALIYIISFIVQAITIILGVFGISLFTGLSFPFIAAGNFEMVLNSICMAVIFFAMGDPYKTGVNK